MAKALYKSWLKPQALQRLEGWKRNGLTDEEIARNIGIRRETLWIWQKKYPNIANALKRGREDVNFIVENALLKKALSGNVTAIIFFLKNSWREKYYDSNISPEERRLLSIRAKKLEADTRISAARAKAMEDNGSDIELLLDKMLDTVTREADKSDDS